ncbi:hypothetical protein [Xanthovirga aplysinae]|uniref:hypothetical protein n=1 Tax=Xanthovirga aplysinae TaxID=2529853 RepID=UPI0012BB983A|nr:hypothetical protein [Xanthovirga aplysinae]MTI33575.1 hypothetical protein [Xanthovirga aplysinae]
MRSFLTFLSFLCLIHFTASAQEELQVKRKGLTLSTGVGHIGLRDPVYTPLVYRGTNILFEMEYSNISLKRKHYFTFNFNSTSLTPGLNDFSTNSIKNLNGFLNYQYQPILKKGKWNAYLGGGIHNFFSLRIFDAAIIEEIAIDFYSSLNLVFSLDRTFNQKHFLEFKFSYPLLAYVIGRMSRPKDTSEEDLVIAVLENPNAIPMGVILKSGDFFSFAKFMDFTTEINYKYLFSKRFALNATYRFRFYKYPKLLTVKYGTSQYVLGLSYTF